MSRGVDGEHGLSAGDGVLAQLLAPATRFGVGDQKAIAEGSDMAVASGGDSCGGAVDVVVEKRKEQESSVAQRLFPSRPVRASCQAREPGIRRRISRLSEGATGTPFPSVFENHPPASPPCFAESSPDHTFSAPNRPDSERSRRIRSTSYRVTGDCLSRRRQEDLHHRSNVVASPGSRWHPAIIVW